MLLPLLPLPTKQLRRRELLPRLRLPAFPKPVAVADAGFPPPMMELVNTARTKRNSRGLYIFSVMMNEVLRFMYVCYVSYVVLVVRCDATIL